MTVRCVGLFVLICATHALSGNFAKIAPDNVMPDADVPVGQAEDNGHEDFVEVVDPEDGLDDIGDVGLLQNGGFAKSEPKNVMPDADGDVVDLTGDDLGDGVVDGPEENGMDVFDDELDNDGMDDMNDEFDDDGMGDEDMNDDFEEDEFDNDGMDDEFDEFDGDDNMDETEGDFDGDFGDDGEWNPDENDGDFDSNYMND